MEFGFLSLPEARFAYLGLAMYEILRTSSFVTGAIWTIILGSVIQIICRYGKDWGELAWHLGGYLCIAFGLVTLVCPEAIIFSAGEVTVHAAHIRSETARNGPEAEVVTAEDIGAALPNLQGPVRAPKMVGMLLQTLASTWVTYARILNTQTYHLFPSLLPLQWFLGTDMTADARSAVADWVHNCYIPVLTGTMEMERATRASDFVPWGDTVLRQALSTRSVLPGAQTGFTWITSTNDPQPAQWRCDTYLGEIERRVQARLAESKTPAGDSLATVFEKAGGIDMVNQARTLIYLEMMRAAGPAVPAPSLIGKYLALRGVGVGGAAISGGLKAGLQEKKGGWVAGIFGGLVGGAKASGVELQAMIDGLSWLVKLAIFVVWFSPTAIGVILAIQLMLLPIVMLMGLFPGRAGVTIATYIGLLAFTTSAPLWWALIDQCSQLAGSLSPLAGTAWDIAVVGWVSTAMWNTLTLAVLTLIVPVIFGSILTAAIAYSGYRSVQTLWKGTPA